MAEVKPEIFDLVRKITSGKCTHAQAERELNRIEEQYTSSVFTYYPPKRKETPWNKAYLVELANEFYCGASSKDFILYMAEVSEKVHHLKRNKFLPYGLIAAAVIAICAIIIGVKVTGGR